MGKAEKPTKGQTVRRNEFSPKRDLDERTAIPLPPEDAIRALLKVDPNSKPADDVPDELEDAARQNAEYPADETGEG